MMKNQNRKSLRIVLAVCLGAAGLLLAPTAARAANNQGTGDVAGDAAALTSSNNFVLTSQQLSLVKKAFLASSGAAITTGATLPTGTLVKFMIYVNNNTALAVSDVSAQDVLAATFAYQTGTIKVDNSVVNCALAACTALEEAAIFAAVDATAAQTDAVDAGVASYNAGATRIDAGNQTVANGQLNITASHVWAMSFTVKMQ
jgi:hypothetical protein